MKHLLTLLFSVLSFTLCLASCDTDNPIEVPETVPPEQPATPGDDANEDNKDDNNDDNNNDPMSNTVTIKVGSSIFTATLADNAAATAFKALLPMTVNMTEMNRNEKYYDLPNSLPTSTSRPGTIQNGDLMLWGGSTLVLFYKTFSSSYSYTPLGRIANPSGLSSALGSGNVTVSFELQ